MGSEIKFVHSEDIGDFVPLLSKNPPIHEEFTEYFRRTMAIWCSFESTPPEWLDENGVSFWRLWLIEIAGKTEGVCGLYTLDGIPYDTSELWLAWLVLLPESRNKGYGVEVLDHLFTYAKSIGCKEIKAYTGSRGLSLNFYKRYGFEVISTVDEYLDRNNLSHLKKVSFEGGEDYVIKKDVTT